MSEHYTHDDTDTYDDVDDWDTPAPHAEPFLRHLPGAGIVRDGKYGGSR
ncbi:hypothetical protein ACFYE2_00630 [Kocuria sp. CPCC 205300]